MAHKALQNFAPWLKGIALLLWALGPSAQGETLDCRGVATEVRPDPACWAFATRDKSPLQESQIIPDETHEILHFDSDSGRIALRFESAEAAARWVARKGWKGDLYPVYRSSPGSDPIWAYDEILVRLSAKGSEAWLSKTCAKAGLEIVDRTRFIPGIFCLRILDPTSGSAFERSKQLARDPEIRWAEPNLYGWARLLSNPNDPFFPNQINHTLIRSPQGWDTTVGSNLVRIAILDEGIDVNHADLAPNIWVNPAEASGIPGVDDDGNGYVDDVRGWDFTSDAGDPEVTPVIEPIGAHGTAVAGLAAAVQDNGIGVSGVAPVVQLISCRVFTGNSIASVANTVRAIEYAAIHADILNLSWGGTDPTSTAILDAIDYALASGRGGKGCVVVAASGNSVDGDSVVNPARYEWTLAVGESTFEEVRITSSSFDENLCLMAPSGLWTTDSTGLGNGFDDIPGEPDYTGDFYGTSGAAPQASGAAALILSLHPNLTGNEVVQALIGSADNPSSSIVPNDPYGKSPTMGYGRLNVERAVSLSGNSLDDRLEPNDTPGDAAPVTSGFYPWLFMGGTLDYYRLEGRTGAPIKATLRYQDFAGELEIRLLDANQIQVATGVAVTGFLTAANQLNWNPPANGTYYLEVCPLLGGNQPYLLDLQCGAAEDAFEPNQVAASSPFLSPGPGTTFSGLVLNDEDFYRVSVNQNEYLYGLLSFDHNSGNLDLDLRDPNGGTIASSQDNWYGDQFVPVQASEAGDYAIRVYGNQDRLNREYALHLAVSSNPPLTAGEDLFAGNGTLGTAQVISPGFYPHLALTEQPPTGNAIDYFRTTIPAGKEARFTVGWSRTGVDIDLFAFDNNMVTGDPYAAPVLSRSTRTNPRVESITLPAYPQNQEVWLAVLRSFGAAQAYTDYRLALEFLDPDPLAMIAYWRLNEGSPGRPAQAATIRDWRGPLFSRDPLGYGGLSWASGPNSGAIPGADGIALDCTSGGFYYPGNGAFGELARPANQALTFWARFKPLNNSTTRFIAGMPGVWEFQVAPDNRLRLTVHDGASQQTYTGPLLTPNVWQEVALVWDPIGGEVALLGQGAGGLVETHSAIGLAFNGTANFHVGSGLGGAAPLGWVEQARYYDRSLTLDEIQGFSPGLIYSSLAHWDLYR